MKAFKLLAALMPALGAASTAAAKTSTTTVVEPVATKTHTQIVFITAAAGVNATTCVVSVCGNSNAIASALSTIRLTSSITTTTTKVITPVDSTTTINNASDKNLSSSCAVRPPSTYTVTVTETSTPVITISVYPVPLSSDANEPPTHTPSYPSISSSAGPGGTPQLPPYLNGSNTVANFTVTTEYVSLHTDIIGALPDNAASISAIEASIMSKYPVNTVHGSISSTEGVFATSSTSKLQPLRLFAILARLISSIKSAKAQITGIMATDQVFGNSVQQIESRFYPYSAPLNSGAPPHLTNAARDQSEAITTESLILGTLTSTSTIISTVTSGVTDADPFTFSFPHLPTASSIQGLNILSTTPNLFATATPVGPISSAVITSTIPETSTVWWSGFRNVTVLVTITVTEPAISTMISETTTLTTIITLTANINVTKTYTAIVTQTTLTGGAAPTAISIMEKFNIFLFYATITGWFVLVAMA